MRSQLNVDALTYWEYPLDVHWGIEIISKWKLQHKDKLTSLSWKYSSITLLSGFSPFTVTNSCASQCIGMWQKPVFQNAYLTGSKKKPSRFQILAPTLTTWKLASWEKGNFLWWEGEGWGSLHREKKSKVHVEIPHYHLFSANPKLFFCIYTWGYSLCLHLTAPAGGFLKILQNTSFFPQVQLFLCLLWLLVSCFWLYFQLLQLQ